MCWTKDHMVKYQLSLLPLLAIYTGGTSLRDLGSNEASRRPQ